MSVFDRALVPRTLSWLVALLFAIACSDSNEIDFFEPGDDTATGGIPGSGGSATGGSSNGGTSAGGSESSGGTTGTTGGSAGDSGGSQAQGGSDSGGMGGTGATGGSEVQGGSAGDAGKATGGMSGSAGEAMGGAGAGGAGGGGAGMAGAGMGGAGVAGAGAGGVGGVGGAGGCVPTMPSTERCDGVDNNCMGGVDEGMACPANCTGATREGHAYIFCSFEGAGGAMRERTWMQAADFCEMRDMDLVFVESAEENAYILQWITRMDLSDQVWMGANDRDLTLQSHEGEWVWGSGNDAVQFWDGDEDGDPVMDRYEDWATGEPNNDGNEDCGVFATNHDYQWDDRNCSETAMNFVCESG